MPLAQQVVGIDFTKGLDTRTDERLVIPGKLLTAQNLTLSDSGALERRDGYAVLNAAAASALNGLATFDDQLLAVNGISVSALAAGNDTLYSAGSISPLTVRRDEIRRAVGYQTEADCASSGTYTCYVWREYLADQTTVSGLYCTVTDEATGTRILNASQLISSTTATVPRVAFVSAKSAIGSQDAFLIAWVDGVNIRVITIPTSTMTMSGATAVAVTATGNLDLLGRDGYALLLWTSSNVTTSVFLTPLYSFNGNVAQNTDVAVAAAATIPGGQTGMAISAFSATGLCGIYLWVIAGGAYSGAWSATYSTTSGTLTHAIANFDATAPTAGNSSRITATAVGVNMVVFYDNASVFNSGGASAQTPLRFATIGPANAVVTAAATLIQSNSVGGTFIAPSGPFIAAKAFTVSGAAYLPVHVGGVNRANPNLQCTWFLLDTSARVAAKALYGTYGLWSINNNAPYAGTPPSTPVIGSDVIVPAGEKGILAFSTVNASQVLNVTPVGLSRLKLSFYGGVPPIHAQLGENTFFAGGALSAYDGAAVTEAGFHLFPEGVTVANGAAGAILAGSYQYVAMYEWVDNAGQRHQSAPSVAVTYVAPGGVKATVSIPTLLLSAKTGINIVVARTVASGTTFYRLNSQTAPVANSTAAATVTYTDNTTDANLVSGELLYTTGGTLASNGPPPCSVLAVHQNRLFIAGTENPYELRYSQPAVTSFGVQWNETLAARVNPVGGAISAMVSMDEKLIVFAARKIFVLLGNGPNATGAQNGYALDELTTDAGCSEPRSVLKMPSGIIFKSAKGWHLLDRGLQVRYIGEGVEAFNASSVCAAVLLDDRKEARFYSATGTTLVYSYLVDQWETFTGQAAVDAVWWPTQSAVVWATAGGAIREDTSEVFTDNGSAITTLIDTGWLKPGNSLHGFQRVYELLLEGPYFSSGSLTLTAYYDYSTSSGDTVTFLGNGFYYSSNFEGVDAVTFNPTSALASPDGASWGLRWKLPQQKCQAVRFRIQETPSGGTLAGLGFSSMSLLVGVKKGAYKLPAAKSA